MAHDIGFAFFAPSRPEYPSLNYRSPDAIEKHVHKPPTYELEELQSREGDEVTREEPSLLDLTLKRPKN